jgi:hypothetical protein
MTTSPSPFLTIFTSIKPFSDPRVNNIQRNALQSWAELGDEVDVLVVGNEAGTPEAVADLGVRHFPQIERNAAGIPLVNSIFNFGRAGSVSPVLAYSNADIIFCSDFLSAVRQVAAFSRDFLIVGRRWNLDVEQRLDFTPGWEEELRAAVRERGVLFTPTAIDYFVFPRHLYTDVPALTVGRAAWDNWMIYHARRQGWAVIDVTPAVMAVHQNHDYTHLPQGKSHHKMDESFTNVDLAGGHKHIYNILDANYRLIEGKIRPQPVDLLYTLRRIERIFLTDHRKGWRWRLVVELRRAQLRLLAAER